MLAATPALALTLEVTHAGPSVVGEAHAFKATVTGANGAVTYEWKFGDADDFHAGGAEVDRTPSRRRASTTSTCMATDAAGGLASAFFPHLVHHPLTPKRPTSSTSIVYDSARNRVYSVNQDNDTVTSIDADTLTKLAELDVYRRPESLALTPEGKLWVVHQDDYAVAVVDPDRFVIERGFRLPYASQPVGVAMSPTGDAAYVSLMAVGKLLKLDPRTGEVIGEVTVGPRPRGIAVSHDGKDVYVTRFISPDTGGEVVKVDAAAMTVATRIVLKLDTETVDSDQQARGLPNYLFSVALTPDGRQAWVPGKKDNIVRGKLRDGRDLTHDTTVRPLAAVIDTLAAQEIFASRIDLDDRSQPVHVEFSPLGNFAILTLAGSNRVEVRDVNRPTQVFSAIGGRGDVPARRRAGAERAAVRAGRAQPQRPRLRHVGDAEGLRPVDAGPARRHPGRRQREAARPGARGKEDLSQRGGHPHVVRGLPQLRRVPLRGRSTTAASTISARAARACETRWRCSAARGPGRAASTGPAPSTRCRTSSTRSASCSRGAGFMPDDVFQVGTRNQPLGDPKAGLSPELDALAAYVASLDHVNPSPYRNPDGSLTADGVAGKALFAKLGCDFCHGGAEFTDSARGALHDVGTITALSGMHAGAPLLGIDTPTLLGVWETPPYLHDGSAPTLRDVLTTKNPTDLHGYVSALSPQQIDQLVAYVLQIDGELPVRPLPFDPPPAGARTAASRATAGRPRGAPGGGGGCGCDVSTGVAWFRVEPCRSWVCFALAMTRRRRGVSDGAGAMVARARDSATTLTMGCLPDQPGGGDRREAAHRLVEAAGGDAAGPRARAARRARRDL